MINIVTSYKNGHRIIFVGGDNWVYADTYEPVDDYSFRPCIKCSKLPTPEGYDACLGRLEGATHACCGHGRDNGYKILKDGTRVDLNS